MEPSSVVVASTMQSGDRIDVDGHIDEPAWANATEYAVPFLMAPVEVTPDIPPTTYRILVDEHNVYIGIHCVDPHPEKIWKSLSRRDATINGDIVSVFIDPTGQRKFAQVFRVAAGGAIRDGTYYEDTNRLDASPDFSFESATHIDADGWTAELKIPATSLRLNGQGEPTILITRVYPRLHSFMFASTPIDERHSCVLCKNPTLQGLDALERGNGLTVTPYASVVHTTQDLGDATKGRAGVDVKWRWNAGDVVDITAWPDFSQVELDTPQLSANAQYAIFYPEKRPFFLEGLDLFDTPMRAVYTRTLTKPTWGARVTHRGDSVDGVLLGARDEGGGLILLPGPFETNIALQPADTAAIARSRFHFRGSQIGLFGALKDYGEFGDNIVAGTDAVYTSGLNRFNAQVLMSSTSALPGSSGLQEAERQNDTAEYLEFRHASKEWLIDVYAKRIGDAFRDDSGFIESNGLYVGDLRVTRDIHPLPGFNRSVLYAFTKHARTLDGETVSTDYFPGIGADHGSMHIELFANPWGQVRTESGRPLHQVPWGELFVTSSPARWLPKLEFLLDFGHRIETISDRVGTGYAIRVTPTLLLRERFRIGLTVGQERIQDDDDLGHSQLLLRDSVAEVNASYFFNANNELRGTYQYHDIYRDPSAYTRAVLERFNRDLVSIVYTWTPSLGKAFYMGGTWSSIDTTRNRAGAELFVKVTWPFP